MLTQEIHACRSASVPLPATIFSMQPTLAGLGNPGEEYKATHHNTGRDFCVYVLRKMGADEPEVDKKSNALLGEAKIGKKKVLVAMPQTYMNNSGKAMKALVRSKKAAQNLVVAYDDLDLPLGTIKISYGRSSGGHNGLESVIKALGTKDFVRIRIGIAPATSSGKPKKPSGEKAIIDFLMGKRRPAEEEALKKVFKKSLEAVEIIVNEGREAAMSRFN